MPVRQQQGVQGGRSNDAAGSATGATLSPPPDNHHTVVPIVQEASKATTSRSKRRQEHRRRPTKFELSPGRLGEGEGGAKDLNGASKKGSGVHGRRRHGFLPVKAPHHQHRIQLQAPENQVDPDQI